MALHALFMRFPFSCCFNFHAAVFFFSQVYFSLLFIVVIRWCFEV